MALSPTPSPVLPASDALSTPREVRAALWRLYRAAMGRYASRNGGILARSLERTEDGWIINEPCPLNTSEMLKAAFLMESKGVAHPFDAHDLLDRMVSEHLGGADYQVVALALWAAAAGKSRHAAGLWKLLREKLPSDASQSMPLAWTLCALCEYLSVADERDQVKGLAREVFHRLLANQDSTTALFYPSARREGWLRRRRADTTLSSQTYPILALVTYARAFGARETLEWARRCADRLCALQGPRGQWWWRYDARRGTVGEQYPVYCVNQDSAVPLALGQLQRELGDAPYDTAIGRGLLWESGHNELSRSMLDESSGFVARSLEVKPDGTHMSWEMYGYQPARFVFTVLSNPAWAAEVGL